MFKYMRTAVADQATGSLDRSARRRPTCASSIPACKPSARCASMRAERCTIARRSRHPSRTKRALHLVLTTPPAASPPFFVAGPRYCAGGIAALGRLLRRRPGVHHHRLAKPHPASCTSGRASRLPCRIRCMSSQVGRVRSEACLHSNRRLDGADIRPIPFGCDFQVTASGKRRAMQVQCCGARADRCRRATSGPTYIKTDTARWRQSGATADAGSPRRPSSRVRARHFCALARPSCAPPPQGPSAAPSTARSAPWRTAPTRGSPRRGCA